MAKATKKPVRGARKDAPTKDAKTDGLGSFLGHLAKSLIDSNAMYGLAHAGAAFGETKAAARLQARATVFAALATKPYKHGEKPRAELVTEAIAVVGDLEHATGAPARLAPAAIDELVAKFEAAVMHKMEAEEERGNHPEVYDRAHAHLRFMRNKLREALGGAPGGAFGFMAGIEQK